MWDLDVASNIWEIWCLRCEILTKNIVVGLCMWLWVNDESNYAGVNMVIFQKSNDVSAKMITEKKWKIEFNIQGYNIYCI